MHLTCRTMDYMQHVYLSPKESLLQTFECVRGGYCEAADPSQDEARMIFIIAVITTKTAVWFGACICPRFPSAPFVMMTSLIIFTHRTPWLLWFLNYFCSVRSLCMMTKLPFLCIHTLFICRKYNGPERARSIKKQLLILFSIERSYDAASYFMNQWVTETFLLSVSKTQIVFWKYWFEARAIVGSSLTEVCC